MPKAEESPTPPLLSAVFEDNDGSLQSDTAGKRIYFRDCLSPRVSPPPSKSCEWSHFSLSLPCRVLFGRARRLPGLSCSQIAGNKWVLNLMRWRFIRNSSDPSGKS
ncbi:MAG: hypothetical protein ACO3JG_16165 [Luteolibacter sp.]